MGELGLKIHQSVLRQDGPEAEAVTAEERADWLIDFILLHQGEGRGELIRKAVDQFLAAEAVGYDKGCRAAWRTLRRLPIGGGPRRRGPPTL